MQVLPTTADVSPLQTTVADGGGNIMYGMWAPDQTDIGARFYLTAVGATSGAQAQNTFTDSFNSISITSNAFTVAVNTCSPAITFGCGGNTSTVSLSSSSTGGKFYTSAANCASQTGAITTDGTTCTPPAVYYRDTTVGTSTITVTAGSHQDTQQETITAAAASKLVYTIVPGTGTAGSAFSVTVQVQDPSGNPSNPTSNTTISLSKA
jgi:hypothetical protein